MEFEAGYGDMEVGTSERRPAAMPALTPGRWRALGPVLATAGGLALAALLFRRTGVHALAAQARAIGPLVPVLLALAGLRYVLQAAGWRLAMPAGHSVTWTQTLGAVVAGEAVGYVGGGMFSREPVKAFSLRRHLPMRQALSAALPERFGSLVSSATLIAVAVGLMTQRLGRAPWPVAVLVASAVAVLQLRAFRRRKPPSGVSEEGSQTEAGVGSPALSVGRVRQMWNSRRRTFVAVAACAGLQEVVNVIEALLLLNWLGAQPTIAAVIAFEGLTRALNAAAVFVPGRLGVSEAGGSFVAGVLGLSSAFGLAVALARRLRSVTWALFGVALLAYREGRDLGRAQLASARL